MKVLSCFIIALVLSLAGSAEATGVPLRFAPRVYVPPPVIVQQQQPLLLQAPAPAYYQQQAPIFFDAGVGYAPALTILRQRAFIPFNTFRGFGVGFGFQRGFRFRR